VIVSVTQKGSLVDIGVENPLLIPDKKLPVNKRITVTVTQVGNHQRLVVANHANIKDYWGYTVTTAKGSFGQITKSHQYDLVIATSKLGVPLQQVEKELSEKWKQANTILIGFGAPSRGLQEIVSKEKLSLDKIADYTLNTIPNQGTETVRTEEAIYITLALLNTLDN